MNDREALVDTVTRLFTRHCPFIGRGASGEQDLADKLWSQIETVELSRIGTPSELGGSGGTQADAAAVLRAASAFAPPVPLAETLVASWLAAQAGIAVPSGRLAVAPVQFGPLPVLEARTNKFLACRLPRVPFAGHVSAYVVLVQRDGVPHVALVNGSARVQPSLSVSGEPRGTLMLEGVEPEFLKETALGLNELIARGALARAQQTAGALIRILEMTVIHALERYQFGRPIASFQAIQQQISDMAGEVAAAAVAAESAAELAESGRLLEAAALAKARTGLAARATAIAHQVHGAIGVTEDHPLHLFTRRIWAWRDEFGSDVEWMTWLGKRVARFGSATLWAEVTALA